MEKISTIVKSHIKDPLKQETQDMKEDIKAGKQRIHHDLSELLKKAKNWFREFVLSRQFVITLFFLIALVYLYKVEITGVSNEYLMLAFFIAYLALLFFFKIDSRMAIGAALILLVATPIYLILKLEAFANYLATVAYFFLVVGVIKQFFEYLRERKTETDAE